MKKIFIFCSMIGLIFSASLASASITSTLSGSDNNDIRAQLNTKKDLKIEKNKKVSPSQGQKQLTASQLSCMRPFIEKRENGIIAAHDTFSAAVKSAMQVRKEVLLKAWNIENSKERNIERKKTWDVFHQSVKTARKAHQESIKEIWKNYMKDAKSSCAISTEGVEPHGLDNLY